MLRGVGAAVLPEDLVAAFRGQLAVVRGPKEPLRDSVWCNELRSARRAAGPEAFLSRLAGEFAEAGPA